jgi:hypothetical protein
MNTEMFDRLFDRWRAWASRADTSEEGWAAGFPEWDDLIAAAGAVMLAPGADTQQLGRLAELWAASDEDEELCDFAKDHITQCLPALRALSDSSLAACRWQVYEAAASAGALGEHIVRKGLGDADSYAKRRAIVALARLSPGDSRQLAESFMSDEDPYVRQAAIDLIAVCGDHLFRSKALAALQSDPVQHVRDYATRTAESLR